MESHLKPLTVLVISMQRIDKSHSYLFRCEERKKTHNEEKNISHEKCHLSAPGELCGATLNGIFPTCISYRSQCADTVPAHGISVDSKNVTRNLFKFTPQNQKTEPEERRRKAFKLMLVSF